MQYSMLINARCSVFEHNRTPHYTVWLEIQYNKSKKITTNNMKNVAGKSWNQVPSPYGQSSQQKHAKAVSIGSTVQSIVHPEKLLFNIHSWQTLRSWTILIHVGYAWNKGASPPWTWLNYLFGASEHVVVLWIIRLKPCTTKPRMATSLIIFGDKLGSKRQVEMRRPILSMYCTICKRMNNSNDKS